MNKHKQIIQTTEKQQWADMNPVFSHFLIYIASIHSDIALGNKAGLLMQNVHSSMSYWQQNKKKTKKTQTWIEICLHRGYCKSRKELDFFCHRFSSKGLHLCNLSHKRIQKNGNIPSMEKTIY